MMKARYFARIFEARHLLTSRHVIGARFRAFVAVTTAYFCVSLAVSARADEPVSLAGRWQAGTLSTRWIVGDWGDSCGPRPSGGDEGAASVRIDESSGELVIIGGGRTYVTTSCWELYPGVRPVGHSESPRAWKTTCKTAATDPRQATLVTSLNANDTSISFYESGQYQFIIKGQNCTASVGRYRTYTLVERDGASQAAATPSASASASASAPPPPRAESRCAHPGPVEKLEVRPLQKLLRAGEDFTFRASASDANGCPIYGKLAWAIESGATLADLSAAGVVHVHPDAAEGEVRLGASLEGRSTVVTIEVASTARYDALLRSGAFDNAGEAEQTAPVAVASQAIGAASAVAEDRARSRKELFVAIVAGVAGILALVGLWALRRSRRVARTARRPGPAKPPLDVTAPAPPKAKIAVAMSPAAANPPQAGPPAPSPAKPSPVPAPPVLRKTICPVCGTQYGAESRFCGRDGATLLPLNQ
jgi:hypothetical protein